MDVGLSHRIGDLVHRSRKYLSVTFHRCAESLAHLVGKYTSRQARDELFDTELVT